MRFKFIVLLLLNVLIAQTKILRAEDFFDLREELLRKTGILAVNNTARFQTLHLETFIKIFETVFSETLESNNGIFPGLRFISAEQMSGPARFTSYKQKLTWTTYYDNEKFTSSGKARVTLYHAILHELAHAFENQLNSTEKQKIFDIIERGWTFGYRGKSMADWVLDFSNDIGEASTQYEKTGDINLKLYLDSIDPSTPGSFYRTKTAKTNFIVSEYSLANEREFFADNFSAYVLGLAIQNEPKLETSLREVFQIEVSNLNPRLRAFFSDVLKLDSEKIKLLNINE